MLADIFSKNCHPRPMMARDSYLCLNGEWEFFAESAEDRSDTVINVPYPPESALSGIGKDMGERSKLIYAKTFTLPQEFLGSGRRIILHLGASDSVTSVRINGADCGTHEGGYIRRAFDITKPAQRENRIEITVTDDHTVTDFPYGKQKYKRGGMWYTPVSGIWQTVWIESVPEEYIRSIKVTPMVKDSGVVFEIEGVKRGEITVYTPQGPITREFNDGFLYLELDRPRLWSPDDPYLYDFTVTSGEDIVRSYFGMREISVKKIGGVPRFCLNGEPIFLHALLHQGYYSDGIFTPRSVDEYESDVLFAKSMGFNSIRMHVKLEAEPFYHYCDKHGIIVIQDFVNCGDYSFIRDTAMPTFLSKKRDDTKKSPVTSAQRERFMHLARYTVKRLYNHPSVCMYTLFNEGWGQFESRRIYKEMRYLDRTRLYDSASGWFTPEQSDVDSIHAYFKKFKVKNTSDKPIFLSEFGGYACKIDGHAFNEKKTYGYKKFKDRQKFAAALCKLYEKQIIPAISKGLCGSVYTQLSDVEDEVNGLITYDRAVVKVKEVQMREIARKIDDEMAKIRKAAK